MLGFSQTSVSDSSNSSLLRDDFVSDEDRKFLDRIQRIRKCVDPNWMPLEGISRNNEHIGIIDDILDLIEQNIGVPIELVPTESWVESLEKLKAGECDVVTSDTPVDTTPEYYTQTVPFMVHRNVYITREDAPLQLDFSLIADKPIGITHGYPTIKLIRDLYGDVNLVEVDDVDEGILKVSTGELYAFTDLLPICSYSIQKQGLSNLKVAGHLDMSLPVVMAVRSDMPELVNILNKAFKQLDAAMVNQYLTKWLKVEYDMKWDWRRMAIYIVIALLVIALILYWNRRLYSLNRRLDRANAELAMMNETDNLTRLKNRQFLETQVPGLVNVASRNKLSLGVAIMDLDHFKRLNDKFGHGVGDKCLHEFAERLRHVFRRESDWVVRYGGEEFMLICIGTSRPEFVDALERLRLEAEKIVLKSLNDEDVRFTVSIGYVYYPCAPEQWSHEPIDQADSYLYRAKSSGRNCIAGTEITF